MEFGNVCNAFKLLRHINHLNRLVGSGDRPTNPRPGLVPFDLMGCADNLPAFASNNDHLHGRVLAVIDLQVTKQNNFKHEWNVNGALVSDLKLVEHLWRILIAGAAATFREVINYEFVLGGIVPSRFS